MKVLTAVVLFMVLFSAVAFAGFQQINVNGKTYSCTTIGTYTSCN